MIGSKSTFKTHSLDKYALKKTYFRGLGEIKLDVILSLLRSLILSDSPLAAAERPSAPSRRALQILFEFAFPDGGGALQILRVAALVNLGDGQVLLCSLAFAFPILVFGC